MTAPGFIHLHLHSAYSLLEGALPVKALAKLAAADRQPALAITDRNNLFGALEFSEYMAGAGIQPIIGCALNVAFPAAADETPRPGVRVAPHHGPVVLLAKDERGYANLMRLSSQAYLDHAEDGAPHVAFADLERCADGLIALSGGPEGPVDSAFAAGNAAVAEARLESLAGLYGDRFYVEIQRHGLPRERIAEPKLLRWAYARGVPIVATNEAYFPKRDAYEAHDALLVHRRGPLRRRGRTPPAVARALAEAAGRDDRAVRRSAGGSGEHRRNRPPLLVPPAAAQADAAAIRRRRQGCGRGRGVGAARAGRGRPCQAACRHPARAARRQRGGLQQAARITSWTSSPG